MTVLVYSYNDLLTSAKSLRYESFLTEELMHERVKELNECPTKEVFILVAGSLDQEFLYDSLATPILKKERV